MFLCEINEKTKPYIVHICITKEHTRKAREKITRREFLEEFELRIKIDTALAFRL